MVIENNAINTIRLELENEIKKVNKKIIDLLMAPNINGTLEELENLFYINDISNFSSVAYDVVNDQYQFGDDYSMYDEPTSVEEKGSYDEAVKMVDIKLIDFFNEKHLLLQIKISKTYVKDFFTIKYNYDPTIIRCYLYYEESEFDYEQLDKIFEYYIVHDIENRKANFIINDYVTFLMNKFYCFHSVNEDIDAFINIQVNNMLSKIKNKITLNNYNNLVSSFENLDKDYLLF